MGSSASSEEYSTWIMDQLERLSEVDNFIKFAVVDNRSICTIDRILNLKSILTKGGGSYILNATYTGNKEKYLVKLCNAELLGQSACPDSAKEIVAMLRYSLLYTSNQCINFLYCVDYGINCQILDRKQHRRLLEEMDYWDDFDEIMENRFSTFLVMNRFHLSSDLSTVTPDFKLTKRQIYEFVYSLLVSVISFGYIPGDTHLDNILIHDSRAGVVYSTDDDQQIVFNSTGSIAHIDYGALRDRSQRLLWSDVALIKNFIEPLHVATRVKSILDNNRTARMQLHMLNKFFLTVTSGLESEDMDYVYVTPPPS